MGCVAEINSRVKILAVGISAFCFLLTSCGGQLTLSFSGLAKQNPALVTWSSPAPITFGEALSATQLNATANVPGTFSYSPAMGSVLKAGVQTLSVTFTPADTSLYGITSTAVSLQVNLATPAITWAIPAPITYGTALTAAQLNATSSVPGTFVYSPAAGTVPSAGAQTLTVVLEPSDTKDYTYATANVPLQVDQLTILISGPSQVRAGDTATYTDSQSGLQGTSVTWSVDGIAGGNADVGTISSAGIYTAPATTGSVTISCSYAATPSVQSSLTVSVLNPIPEISSAAVISSSASGFIVDIIGTGFIAQSSVGFDGLSAQTTFLSGTELETTIPQNASSGATVVATVSNPSPGAATSNAIEIAFPPSSLKQLVGCTNPYTGASTGTWGTSSSPVYIPLTYTTQLIGTPTYTTNSIFWISRETGPGESVLMTGAFTGEQKSAKIALIPTGTIDWQSLVQKSTTTVPTTQQGSTGLSFVIPVQFPPGVYGFEIDDPSAQPILGLANAPSMDWAIGVPSGTVPSTALQSQVHDCAAEPGEVLRVFGKNFLSSSQLILESSSGSAIAITPSKVDSNSIAAHIPGSLAPGTYYAWVGDYPWDATSSPVSVITIVSPPSFTVTFATCSALVGDGQTDNTALLQSCLDSNTPVTTANQLVYLLIPNGVFLLTNGVMLHSGELLVGSSPATTTFVGESPSSPPQAWVTVSQYAGMANVSLVAPGATSLVSSSDTTGNPSTSGHVFFQNVTFDSEPSGSSSSGTMVALYGPDIQVYDSSFRSGTSGNMNVEFGDGGIISGNTFIDNIGLNGVGPSQNMIIETNTVYSENGPSARGAAAFDLGRSICAFCKSMVSQNNYIGYNTIQNMGAANNQLILTDGGGGAYYGPVASSTADTVVLADDPSWEWVGTSNPQAVSIAIVSGTGVGQHSFLESFSGRTLILAKPWTVIPDSTSIVVVTASQLNLTIAHNKFTDTLGMSVLIAYSIDAVIEDNNLTNSGQGILLWGYGPYGGPAAFAPIMNTDVLRNTIAVGAGDLLVSSPNENAAGIGIFDGYGIMVSGLMIRDNVVAPIQSIYSIGNNGISANVIEENQATWVGPNPSIPGFLVWNNATP